MKRARKFVAIGLGAVILIVVVAVVWIDQLAKLGVEAGGRFAFGVPTKLDSASIGMFSGRSHLAGLDIANPEGFETPHLLKLNDAVLAVSLASLAGDTVVIPEFSLAGVDVNLESKGGQANFKIVLGNLQRFESSQKEPQGKQAAGSAKKFVIREIIVKDVKVNVALLPIGGSVTRVTVPIQELRLRDVGTGSEKGVVLAQVAGTLLKAIIVAALEQGGSVIPGELLRELNGALAKLAPLKEVGAALAVNVNGTLKDLGVQAGAVGEQLTQQAQDAAKKLEDAAQGAQQKLTEGLGDLLKNKEDKPK